MGLYEELKSNLEESKDSAKIPSLGSWTKFDWGFILSLKGDDFRERSYTIKPEKYYDGRPGWPGKNPDPSKFETRYVLSVRDDMVVDLRISTSNGVVAPGGRSYIGYGDNVDIKNTFDSPEDAVAAADKHLANEPRMDLGARRAEKYAAVRSGLLSYASNLEASFEHDTPRSRMAADAIRELRTLAKRLG